MKKLDHLKNIFNNYEYFIIDLWGVVHNGIKPYEGAIDFLSEIREKYQVIILSDTFFNLSAPIFKKLNYPTVFCHKLL